MAFGKEPIGATPNNVHFLRPTSATPQFPGLPTWRRTGLKQPSLPQQGYDGDVPGIGEIDYAAQTGDWEESGRCSKAKPL